MSNEVDIAALCGIWIKVQLYDSLFFDGSESIILGERNWGDGHKSGHLEPTIIGGANDNFA